MFVFFGLVAVARHDVHPGRAGDLAAVAGAVGVGRAGLRAAVANNLRDIPTDAVAGKRTLAVVLGDRPHPHRSTRRWSSVPFAAAVAAGVADAWCAARPARRAAARSPRLRGALRRRGRDLVAGARAAPAGCSWPTACCSALGLALG